MDEVRGRLKSDHLAEAQPQRQYTYLFGCTMQPHREICWRQYPNSRSATPQFGPQWHLKLFAILGVAVPFLLNINDFPSQTARLRPSLPSATGFTQPPSQQATSGLSPHVPIARGKIVYFHREYTLSVPSSQAVPVETTTTSSAVHNTYKDEGEKEL